MPKVDTTEVNSAKAKCVRAGCGYITYKVEHYKDFIHEVLPRFASPPKFDGNSELRGKPLEFVWRGMRDKSWLLQSTFSREASNAVRETGPKWQSKVCEETILHVIEYLERIRGLDVNIDGLWLLHDFLMDQRRRSHKTFNDVLAQMPKEMFLTLFEVLAIGQHYGLLTPFLDWTTIPLISLYFAFASPDGANDGIGHRVVFALNKTAVEVLNTSATLPATEDIRFIDVHGKDNRRIVGQAGLFTYVPAHLPVDSWVVRKCNHEPWDKTPVLLRFLIRNVGRRECLQELAAMNIHARTVFPDLIGAAIQTNARMDAPTKIWGF